MTISTVETLEELASERTACAHEEEAWKVAQLAAVLRGATISCEGPNVMTVRSDVEQARFILAEARRQTTEPIHDAA